MSFSIVICTVNRPTEVGAALRSCLSQSRLPDEIIVVDGSPGSETENLIRKAQTSAVPLVYVRTPAGLTLQRNAGVRVSTGGYVQFIDDDVELNPDYLLKLEAALDICSDGLVRAAQGALEHIPLVRDGSPQGRSLLVSALSRLFLLPSWGRGRIKLSGFGETPRGFAEPVLVQTVSGCGCFDRRVFESISFDEVLTSYGWMEDIDIARQLRSLGAHCLHVPDACFRHSPATGNRLKGYQIGLMRVRNHHYLYRKHSSGPLRESIAFWWSVLGLLLVSFVQGEWRRLRGELRALREMATGSNPLLAGPPSSGTKRGTTGP